jgi:hypothetical protein
VVALGIDIDGTKHPLALVGGSTENATLVTELIVGLRERGPDVTRPILAVLDGSKALRRAVVDVFDRPVIGRCQRAGAEAVLAESGVPGLLISSLAATPPHRPPRAAAAPSRRCFRHCWLRRRDRVSCGVACSGHGLRNLAAMMTRQSPSRSRSAGRSRTPNPPTTT